MNFLTQSDSPASRYYQWWERGDPQAREETAPLELPRPVPEAEWQMRWFAGELGREFTTTCGERLEVLDFGRWNREEGPRFVDAVISVAGGAPIQGAIALHSSPLEWLRVAAESPDYNGVVLHLYPGDPGERPPAPSLTREGRAVHQVALLPGPFAFPRGGEEIPPPEDLPPPLAELEERRLLALLEAAAQYRLCRKLADLRRSTERFGPQEALYQALAETLGYRSNRLPFRLLAQRFTLEELRANPEAIEAVLFAGSGFMNATELAAYPGDSRSYLRQLWKVWWPCRTGWEWLTLPPEIWQSGGTRPVNHPQRRLAALSLLVGNWPIVHNLAAAGDPRTLQGFFRRLSHPYWDHHYTLTSRQSPTRMALVGPSRVSDMLANVFIPHALSGRPDLWRSYRLLPASDANRRVTRAIRRFLGRWNFSLKLRMIHQQGLLQLDEDHHATGGNDTRLAERVHWWQGRVEED